MWHSTAVLAVSEGFFESTWAGLDNDERFVVLLVLIGCGTFLLALAIAASSGTYYYLARRRSDIELKQDMLDRGMSADEVVQVIKAAPVEDAASRWVEGWCNKKKGRT